MIHTVRHFNTNIKSIFFGNYSMIPVSYTHLDVYKRQQLHSGPVPYYDSVAQLPYLVLDESACGPGQLVRCV